MANKSNQYFQSNYFGAEEQALVDSLTIESIQIHGIGVKYIPRVDVALDELFGEDQLSSFNEVFEIEMYIKNFEQFGGDGDFLSKFGLEIRDEVILQVSKTRWEEDITNGSPPNPELPRPREGDLIYFPFSGRLFEIHFVEHEDVFYQLGKLYTYEIRCKLFEYSSQQFNTSDPDIDKIEDYTQQTLLILDTGTGDYIGVYYTVTGATGSTAGAGAYTDGAYPAVATTGGSGTGLTVDITVSGGSVDTITINSQGDNSYLPGDVITVPAGVYGPQFTFNTVMERIGGEQVYQGTSLATAYASGEVVSWDSGTKQLIVGISKGIFAYGANIIGDTSGADWSYTDTSYQERNQNDKVSDNVHIEEEYDEFGILINNRLK